MKVFCPYCKKEIEVKPPYKKTVVGIVTKCPKCGEVIKV